MGRHRRSGAGGAATGRATGAPAPYADDYAGAPEPRTAAVSHRRKGRVAAPVRTGLLGVSAAVAMGAVAIASGLVPGSDNYSLGGGGDSNKVRSASSPTGVAPQGGADTDADAGRESATPSRGTDRTEAPDPSPSQSTETPSRKPSEKPSSQAPKPKPEPEETTKAPSPSRTAPQKPKAPPASAPSSKSPSAEATAEAAVLTLVNEERAKVGCSPVRADDSLASLAGDFSSDMATRDFFDHTDLDGATPWDRAEKAGIANLGGENIARGQANAQSVMDAWMNSPGHRANILNCDYKTLGVGAHFAPGGPWWTQDFGF
ncbi:CAP domain-containing protein [Streptomyces sp. NBC_01381]|uniref:CAP domain-containing protein n=1 Tax=Streptomyces sp. NBC_01381 TaxID=2903845 RepID=UPI0022527271|nr:CAP domain-containing protein [Streptomyces sp. NBC_01381]MCX4670286.1 CAP domain-containing protein [Streptomyces sp. NBC_01381]